MVLLADGEKRIHVQIRDIKFSRDCSENMKTWYVHIKVHNSAPSQRRLQGEKVTPKKGGLGGSMKIQTVPVCLTADPK